MKRKWIKITLILITVLGALVTLVYFIRQIYFCVIALYYVVIIVFMYGGM